MADTRAKLLCKSGYSEALNGPGAILGTKGGIVFPYTPVITTQTQVAYNKYDLTHTNYQPMAFSHSQAPMLQVTANFIQQSTEDVDYLLGALHFFRVVTKMNFGQEDPQRGTPPPVLEFSAYGPVNFSRVPVLVQGVSTTYPDDIDYVMDSSGDNRVPAMMTIAIDLGVHYSPSKTRNQFSLNGFASGELYSRGFI